MPVLKTIKIYINTTMIEIKVIEKFQKSPLVFPELQCEFISCTHKYFLHFVAFQSDLF